MYRLDPLGRLSTTYDMLKAASYEMPHRGSSKCDRKWNSRQVLEDEENTSERWPVSQELRRVARGI